MEVYRPVMSAAVLLSVDAERFLATILKHTVVVRLHPLILSLKGKLQIRLMSSRGSQCASIWSYSISVSMAPCHGAETGSIPVGTAKFYSVRLSVRTQDFHSCKRGSTPLQSTKFCKCWQERKPQRRKLAASWA